MQVQHIKNLLIRGYRELTQKKLLAAIGLFSIVGLSALYLQPATPKADRPMSATKRHFLPLLAENTVPVNKDNGLTQPIQIIEQPIYSPSQISPKDKALGNLMNGLKKDGTTTSNNASTPTSLVESQTPEYVILQPIEEATFSSETTASVSAINVKEGSYFQRGTILLELDCRVQQADYEKSKAQQNAALIALRSAEKLKSYGSISEFELVKAKSEAAMVNADVNKLSAILDKCIIKAPFNGAVSDVMIHTHETVKPGDPLMKIVNTDHIIVELEVPSDWLRWLHINSNFRVHVNEINKSIPAKIVRINPKIEPVSQTVRVIGEVSTTPDDRLLPGMSGQAYFPDNPDKKTKSN